MTRLTRRAAACVFALLGFAVAMGAALGVLGMLVWSGALLPWRAGVALLLAVLVGVGVVRLIRWLFAPLEDMETLYNGAVLRGELQGGAAKPACRCDAGGGAWRPIASPLDSALEVDEALHHTYQFLTLALVGSLSLRDGVELLWRRIERARSHMAHVIKSLPTK